MYSSVRETFAVVIILGAALLIVMHCSGCTNTQRQHAILIADYEAQLEKCREMGKATSSFSVYEACAKSVDRQLCVDKGLRCRDAEGRDVNEPR